MTKNRGHSAKDKEELPVKGLFSHLQTIIDVSEDKFLKKRAKDLNRLRWGRLLISAIDSYGSLYKVVELEELEKRISELESQAKKEG